MDLVIGAGKLDRTLENVEALVDAYPTDDGLRYLDYRLLTSRDQWTKPAARRSTFTPERLSSAGFL